MSMFSSIAKVSELQNLLSWIEDHVTIDGYIDYQLLKEEIEARIKAADLD